MHTTRTTSTGMRLVAATLGATIAVAGLGIAPLAFAEEASPDEMPLEQPVPNPVSVVSFTVDQINADPTFAEVNAAVSIPVRVAVTNDAEAVAQFYDAVDALRAEQGLGALTRDAALETAAYQRGAESTLLSSPIRPDGSLFTSVDPSWRIAAEILVNAPADQDLDASAALAALGDDQRALIAAATNIGVARVVDAQGNSWWAVELAADSVVSETPYTPAAGGETAYSVRVNSANLEVPVWSGDLTVDVSAPQTLSIAVNVAGTIAAGPLSASFTPTATVLDNTGLGWNSSNAAVATVDAFGTVSGVGSGTCTVSALIDAVQWQFIYNTTVTGGNPAATTVNLADCTIAGITDPFTATGAPIEPTFTVIDANQNTVDPSLYSVSFSNNVEPGTATVAIVANGLSPAVTGEQSKQFQIVAAPAYVPGIMWWYAADAQAALEAAGLTGVGTEGEPAPDEQSVGLVYDVSADEGAQLDAGTTVEYTYYGPIAAPVEGALDLVEAQAILNVAPVAYHAAGEPAEPTASVSLPDGTPLSEGTDFTVSYSNNTENTTEENPATVTAEGIGAYTGTLSAAFQVAPQPATVTDLKTAGYSIAEIPAQTFNVDPVRPTVSLNGPGALVEGTDYTVTFTGNDAPGTATVTVEGIGAYEGTLTQTFSVLGDIARAGVSGLENQVYTGAPLTPAPAVTFGLTPLTAGTDYDVAYTNNVNAGTAVATITGKGLYTGSVDVAFTITAKSIKGSQISPIASVPYNGTAQTPTFTVTDGTTVLAEGADYAVSFEQNVNAGTAHVVVTGTGNYRDSIDTTFVIAPIDMSRTTVVMPNQSYTGAALTPKPVSVTAEGLTLVEGTDYVIAGYANNVNVGDARISLQGKGNFTGSVTASWKIVQQGTPDAGTTQTLPKTGDSTNLVGMIVGAAVGVVLIGVAIGLIVHRARSGKRR